MTDKQFEKIECISKKLWEDINNGHEYSMVTYTEFLGIVTEVWEGLQEEPASDDLEEASKYYALNNTPWDDCKDEMQDSFKAGAKWQKEKDESVTKDLEEYINELSKQFPEVSFAKLSRIAVRVAKWQKEQVIREAINGIARPDDDEVWCDLKPFNLKDGDKVKIIIIEKD